MEQQQFFTLIFATICVFLICLIFKYKNTLSFERTKYSFLKGVYPLGQKIKLLKKHYEMCVSDLNKLKTTDRITKKEVDDFLIILKELDSSTSKATTRLSSIAAQDKEISKKIINKIDTALDNELPETKDTISEAIKESFQIKESFAENNTDITEINNEINIIKNNIINKIDSLYNTDVKTGDLQLIDKGIDSLIESRIRMKKSLEQLASSRLVLIELNNSLQSKLTDLESWSKTDDNRRISLGIQDSDNIDQVISKLKTGYNNSYPALAAIKDLKTWATSNTTRLGKIGIIDSDTDYDILNKIKSTYDNYYEGRDLFDSLVNWTKDDNIRKKALGINTNDTPTQIINKMKNELNNDTGSGIIDILYSWSTSPDIKQDLNITEVDPSISLIVLRLKTRYVSLVQIENRAISAAEKLNTLSEKYDVSITNFDTITNNIVDSLNKLTDTEENTVTDIDRLKNMLTEYKNTFSGDDNVRIKVESIISDLNDLISDTSNYDSLLVKVSNIMRTEGQITNNNPATASDITTARLNALQTYITGLKSSIESTESTRDGLQSTLNSINTTLTSYGISSDPDLMERFNELTALISNINSISEIMNNNSAVSDLTTKNLYISKLLTLLQTKLSPLISGTNKIISDLPVETADADRFRVGFETLASEINTLFTYVKSIDGVNSSNMDTAKTELNNVIDSLQNQSSRLGFINTKINNLLTTDRKNKITQSALTGDDAYKNQILNIELYVQKLESDISTKTSAAETLQQDYDNLTSNYNSLSTAVGSLFNSTGITVGADGNLITKLNNLGLDINELVSNVSAAKIAISSKLNTIDNKISSIKQKINNVVFYMPSGRYMYYNGTGTDVKSKAVLDLQLGRFGRKARDVYGAPEAYDDVPSEWDHIDGTSFNNVLFKGEHSKLYYDNVLGKNGTDFNAESTFRFVVPSTPISTNESTRVLLSDLGGSSCSTIPPVYASAGLCNLFKTKDDVNCQFDVSSSTCMNMG